MGNANSVWNEKKNSTPHELLMTSPAVNLQLCQIPSNAAFLLHICLAANLELLVFRSERKDPSFVARLFLTPRWEATKIDSAHVYLRLISRRSQQGFQLRVLSRPPEECRPLSSRRSLMEPWGLCSSRCSRPRKVPCGFSSPSLSWVNRIRHGKKEQGRKDSNLKGSKWTNATINYKNSECSALIIINAGGA